MCLFKRWRGLEDHEEDDDSDSHSKEDCKFCDKIWGADKVKQINALLKPRKHNMDGDDDNNDDNKS